MAWAGRLLQAHASQGFGPWFDHFRAVYGLPRYVHMSNLHQVVKYLISRRADLAIGTRDENATAYDYAARSEDVIV